MVLSPNLIDLKPIVLRVNGNVDVQSYPAPNQPLCPIDISKKRLITFLLVFRLQMEHVGDKQSQGCERHERGTKHPVGG